MKLLKALPLIALAPLTIWLTACSSGTSNGLTPTPPATLSVSLTSQPPSSITVSTTTFLAATVNNDTANAGVKWSVACGGTQCGSISPTTTANGIQTTYTAPAAVPSPATVTVTATSVTDATKSASAAITITATPPVILGDGTYVYHFSGQDSTGPYFVAGALTVKSGAITAGEQDFGDLTYAANNQLIPSGSGLSVAGGNIQVILNTGNPKIGVNGIETLRGTVVNSKHVAISEFDSFAAGTGSLDIQTSTAAPSGGYAFGLSGWDGSVQANQLVIGGVLNVISGSLNVAGSVFDYNDGGFVGQAQTFASGSVSAPDSFGRVTFALVPASTSQLPAFVLTGYITGANAIQLVESQVDALSADLGGVALGLGSNTGHFSTANVINTSYAYGSAGADTNNDVNIAGGFGFNTNGTVSGDLALNDLTNVSGNTITGTYTVDPTGRVTLSGIVPQPLNVTFTFQLYLDGNGNGIELGVDTLQATEGLAYIQTAPSADFEGNFAISGQGELATNGLPFWGAVGPVTVASDTFNGTTDNTVQGNAPTPSVALTGTETPSTGLLKLTGLNALNFQSTNAWGYYPIDGSRTLAIEIDGKQLGLILLEGVTH